MRTTQGFIPAYNVHAAVDAEHALIVAQQVSDQAADNRSLQPMAEAAQTAVSGPAQPLNVVADAGYSNGEQAEACEAKGHLAACARQPWREQSWRWQVVRPHGIYLST
jgi:hypothetical protein